jgi:hypothetical protein
VIERSNHSFDPFPDDGRVLPFGSAKRGCPSAVPFDISPW